MGEMSEAFEELQGSVTRGEVQRAVEDAERDIAGDRWVEHSEVVAKLQRWTAGQP